MLEIGDTRTVVIPARYTAVAQEIANVFVNWYNPVDGHLSDAADPHEAYWIHNLVGALGELATSQALCGGICDAVLARLRSINSAITHGRPITTDDLAGLNVDVKTSRNRTGRYPLDLHLIVRHYAYRADGVYVFCVLSEPPKQYHDPFDAHVRVIGWAYGSDLIWDGSQKRYELIARELRPLSTLDLEQVRAA